MVQPANVRLVTEESGATRYAPIAHTQTASTITDFNAAADARVVSGVAGKANTSHTQAASTITDFTAAADARVVAGITGKANLAHAPFHISLDTDGVPYMSV